jgi:hypothetical protein
MLIPKKTIPFQLGARRGEKTTTYFSIWWLFSGIEFCFLEPLPLKNPRFCIRCWERQKAPCLPFHLCELEEKVLHLGCTVDENITRRAFRRRLNQTCGKAERSRRR